MTDTEIYNRTSAAVSTDMHRKFGPIHSMPIGQASALVGFASSLIESAIERYRVTRRRRPWCRLPWQRGRRPSPQSKCPMSIMSDSKFWSKIRQVSYRAKNSD